QHQVIVAEMRPADMPVEILSLEIKRKGVSQDAVERFGERADSFGWQIGRSSKGGRRSSARDELLDFSGHLVGFLFGLLGRTRGLGPGSAAGGRNAANGPPEILAPLRDSHK